MLAIKRRKSCRPVREVLTDADRSAAREAAAAQLKGIENAATNSEDVQTQCAEQLAATADADRHRAVAPDATADAV